MGALAIVMCYFFRVHLAFLNKLAEDGELDYRELGISSQLGDGGGDGEARGVPKSFRYML